MVYGVCYIGTEVKTVYKLKTVYIKLKTVRNVLQELIELFFCRPVNLVDSYENRFAFACAFGATATKCLSILFLSDYDEIFTPEFNQWIKSPEVPSFTGSTFRNIFIRCFRFMHRCGPKEACGQVP